MSDEQENTDKKEFVEYLTAELGGGKVTIYLTKKADKATYDSLRIVGAVIMLQTVTEELVKKLGNAAVTAENMLNEDDLEFEEDN